MVQLYRANLLTRASESVVVKALNNAPGGVDGVDPKVQSRLGATGSPLPIVDRKHGICCGITVAWLIGLVNNRSEARTVGEFDGYFKNVLRFQGAYLKDAKGNIGGLDELAQSYVHGCKKLAGYKQIAPHTLAGLMPKNNIIWAAYLALYHHAIGIGYANYRYFIMEPNAGLFSYQSQRSFLSDVRDLVEARRVSKKLIGPGQAIGAWFYTA